MKRVLRIPGQRIEDASVAAGADLSNDQLRAAGLEVELETVIDVAQSREGGFEDVAIEPVAPPPQPKPAARRGSRGTEAQAPLAVGRVCQVELESGARLWLRPESFYEMFGARPTRGALPEADKEVWQIEPVVTGASGTRAGMLDRIVKVANWVVKPLAGVSKGFVAGKPVHNLAKAIEDQQHGDRPPGIYSLSLTGEPVLTPCEKIAAAGNRPVLVFLHGTLSSTPGSFSGLWEPNRPDGVELRKSLMPLYGETVYALEHYTLTESPVGNALAVAKALPSGARLHLVSHSRGGLVGELLCLSGVQNKSEFSPKALADLLRKKAEDPDATATDEARKHWKEETDAIERLVTALYEKNIRVERFVRVACPSEGTTLAMRKIDVWLSIYKHFIDKSFEGLALKFFSPAIPLRALIGLIAQPDAADKLPGIWAMVPGNPLISLINFQALEVDADLSVISGNNEGKGILKGGLEALLNRFFKDENDYVVNTGAMYGGLPRESRNARFQLDKGTEVTHFNYFINPDSVRWVKAGLTRPDGDSAGFRDFGEAPKKAPHLRAVLKPRPTGPRPIVFVLPGIMGSEIAARDENIWLNYGRIARGRIGEIAIEREGVTATQPIDDYYGELIEYLCDTHEVMPLAYDWRRSVFDSASRLAGQIAKKLDEQNQSATPMPVRILAHSLGGLVVRALIAGHPEVWKRMCAHDGARVVMLGTPNGGSHEIVRLLLAQSGTLQKLALLDLTRGTRELLQIIKAFPGVLELLPLDDGGYFSASTWSRLQTLDEVGRDEWLPPDANDLSGAQAALQRLTFADKDARRVLYVAGCADETPSGWVEDIEWDYGSGTPRKTIAFTCSPRGDGRVLWETGIPPQVATWYMPGIAHGDLCNAPEYFAALLDLVDGGNTDKLPRTPPARRAAIVDSASLIRRDAVTEHPSLGGRFGGKHPSRDSRLGGTGVIDDLMGRAERRALRKPLPDKAKVSLVHGNLRYARFPVVMGHYAGDTMVGAEADLDRSLGGALKRRSQLGLYAGAAGTATVELQTDPRARPAGAIVIGLGRPDTLTPGSLREGMTRAALEYALIRLTERSPADGTAQSAQPIGARLSCLLVGSGAGGMTVRNSIAAMLGGIGAANRRLAELDLAAQVWIDEVELLELWLDKAAQATEALELALKDGELAELFVIDGQDGAEESARAIIRSGEGGLRRIDFTEAPAWWQRLEITYDKRLNQLKYVAMSDRARAEEMLVSGQMQTAERFIWEAIDSASRNADVSRTLFEMLVPNRLKELAPDQQDVWLLVDERSGAFPWELLEDRWSRDGKPLAVASGMLRQFKTIEYRERPAMAISDAALVIGNPALPMRPDFPFLELPGAQQEAEQVAALLESHRFEVARQIQTNPSRIFAKLHGRDYRILHLAGHGAHEWPIPRKRPPADDPNGPLEDYEDKVSGMLVGDLIFLTPGDVEQMRFVPELVFVNCCHLGRLSSDAQKAPWRLGNKLAANLAAQFIRMGVRAVVAAGWEVDDGAALTFATSFYDHLLSGDAFGYAVKQAREVTFLQHGGTNTWGAFQCYGDPNWQLRARARSGGQQAPSPLRSVAHAVVELDNLRDRLRTGQDSAAVAMEARLRQLKVDHADWLGKAEVAAAAGIALGEVERFDEAIEFLNTAAGSGKAQVSLQAIEQRANFAVKKALKDGLAEGATKEQVTAAIEAMRAARDDLNALLRFGETDERLNLLGSAWKRQSWIAQDKKTRSEALRESFAAYRRASEKKNKGTTVGDAYPLTNMLTSLAVLRWFGLDQKHDVGNADALIAAAIQWAEQREAKGPDFWSTVATADARLSGVLLLQVFDQDSRRRIRDDYQRAIRRGASKKEIGSVREQIDYLIQMARLAKKASHAEGLLAVRSVLN